MISTSIEDQIVNVNKIIFNVKSNGIIFLPLHSDGFFHAGLLKRHMGNKILYVIVIIF